MSVPTKALTALIATCGIAGLLGSTPSAYAASFKGHTPRVPDFRHVFVIVMENHSYHDLMDENDVPYLHHLATHYGLATSYYGVTNPSVGDRVALLSGETAGTELPHSKTTGLSQKNLVDQLSVHHLSWGAFYQHSRLSSSQNPVYRYKEGHSTFLRFQDIASNPNRTSHLHPLRDLSTALSSNTVPNFVWISPNSIGNMEGGYRSPGQFTFQGAGPGGSTTADSQLEQGGNTFLKTWIPKIMNSRAWHQGHNAIFIAFDETSYDASMPQDGYWLSHKGVAGSPIIAAGTNLSGNSHFLFPGGMDGGGHTLAMVLTNHAHHVVSSTPYNEYSILKTIEAGWHLGYLHHTAAHDVHPMSQFFGPPTKPYSLPSMRVGSLTGYNARLKTTPTLSPVSTPEFHSSSSEAGVLTSTNPYFVRGIAHQVGSTLIIHESRPGVLSGSVSVNLAPSSGRNISFSSSSHPVATTKISDPSAQGVQFTSSSVTSSTVKFPVVTPSQLASTAIITGLTLNIGSGAPIGPVTATVSSHGQILGTVNLGTVGKPRPTTVPEMMAPVALRHHMAFPFIPPIAPKGQHQIVLRIEGQYPTSQANDPNQYRTFASTTNVPVIADSRALLTPQAGKQYWIEAKSHQNRTWSMPATFSVSR